MDSVKRKRLENYEEKDTALILSLVDKYDYELQSLNVAEKHKTWLKIEKEFNSQKVGIVRDMLCLKNKWKNLKAQNVKNSLKFNPKTKSEYQESVNSADEDSKSLIITPEKKRSSNFNDRDTNLLIKLIIKNGLNDDEIRVATSKVAVEAKNKSWIKLLNAFNNLKTGGNRTITELKIKYKNLKQKDFALFVKSNEESDDCPSVVEEIQIKDDNDDKDFIPKIKATHTPIKRGEKFNVHDSKLFIKLMKKYSKVLNSRELTKAAINSKKESWSLFEEDFNSNCKGEVRSIFALKNKFKNLRANARKGISESEQIFNIDSDTEDEEIESLEYDEGEFLNQEDFNDDNTIIFEENTSETKYTTPLIQEIDVIPASQVIYPTDLKDIERENLILKNEVLKRKKRLLDLEIAIAEKKLRGQ